MHKYHTKTIYQANKTMTSTSTREKFQAFLAIAKLETKQHQLDGVEWCVNNEVNGHMAANTCVRGGLIADAMGLGKTIQMIGTIVCNFKRHTLIVVPRALLEQWETAVIRTTNHEPVVYHGTKAKTIQNSVVDGAPIVITTYGMVSLHTKSPLKSIKWDRIIFDEAHHLRNSKTTIYQSALSLKSNIRWLVTGTPIQNRKNDFYSLCAQIGMPQPYYSNSENLVHLTRSFILRRTKEEAGITLPKLHVVTTEVHWETKDEKDLAEDIHSFLHFSHVDTKSERQINNQIAALEMPMLVSLVRARQACIYPRLMKDNFESLIKAGLLDESSTYSRVMQSSTSSSSKINAVIKTIVERKNNKNAKIVFCHYRGEIDEIKHRLLRHEMTVETFDGRTTQRERERVLTTECDVLILQIQTGCEGLNLQHFSEVYFVSPHWNPAVEDQAIARCHRIGQTKETHVFRFNMSSFHMSCDEKEDDTENPMQTTIEQYSIKVQEAKREIMTMLEE